MPSKLDEILRRTAEEWVSVCNHYAQWEHSRPISPGRSYKETHNSERDGGPPSYRFVDSPVGYGERPLMGLLLQAFKRAHCDLPCIPEVSTERHKAKGPHASSRTPDFWFGFRDGADTRSVYVDGKVAFAYWSRTKTFDWHTVGGKKLTWATQDKEARGQLKLIADRDATKVIALFVVLEVPLNTREGPELWCPRFTTFLTPGKGSLPGFLEQALSVPFGPGTPPGSAESAESAEEWKNLQESAKEWKRILKSTKETKFYPHARLFLYEVSR